MSLVSLAQAIVEGPENKLAEFTIRGEDETGAVVINERPLQFYPETINDAYAPNWIDKQIPGGSHPIKQWVANSARTISFQVIISRDILPDEQLPFGVNVVVKPQSDINAPFNKDIREEIAFLRSFCYPSYADSGGVTVAVPPPVAILNAPNMGWAYDGGDEIVAVMTNCSVNYLRVFEEGFPRLATVDLAFSEIVQQKGEVQFHDWKTLYEARVGKTDEIGGG